MNTLTMNYADEDLQLADAIFKIFKEGDTTYNTSDLEGFGPDANITITVDTKSTYATSINGEFVEDYWTPTTMAAKKHRHWAKEYVTITISQNIWGEPVHLATVNTWFAKQNTSFTDVILGRIFFDWKKTRSNVEVEWARWARERDADLNYTGKISKDMAKVFLGTLLGTASHCEKLTETTTTEMMAMFKDVA